MEEDMNMVTDPLLKHVIVLHIYNKTASKNTAGFHAGMLLVIIYCVAVCGKQLLQTKLISF